MPYKQFKSTLAFPKGHLENNENNLQAAKREVYEEVGLKPKFDLDFCQSYTYRLTEQIEKKVTLFLAKAVKGQQIKLQASEIRQAHWLNYEKAQQLFEQQNYQEFNFTDLLNILSTANDYLERS